MRLAPISASFSLTGRPRICSDRKSGEKDLGQSNEREIRRLPSRSNAQIPHSNFGSLLHAQEIDFNDIRTTLQALYAIYDNCNSLHTNAYDEAITTPTEESVRRAMAIQLIINKELGLAMNENPMQGSFVMEELTDLVEEAVLLEFDQITERGGVLGRYGNHVPTFTHSRGITSLRNPETLWRI